MTVSSRSAQLPEHRQHQDDQVRDVGADEPPLALGEVDAGEVVQREQRPDHPQHDVRRLPAAVFYRRAEHVPGVDAEEDHRERGQRPVQPPVPGIDPRLRVVVHRGSLEARQGSTLDAGGPGD